GRVATRVAQQLAFSNVQQFALTSDRFVQDIAQSTSISSGTETRGGGAGVRFAARRLSYPLAVDISGLFKADGTASQTTAIDQGFDQSLVGQGGGPRLARTVVDRVRSKDTLLIDSSGLISGFQDRGSSQSYFSQGSGLACYGRSIVSANGLLTSVTDGGGCL